MLHRTDCWAPYPMHPCLACGACCAHYRVSLHWSEADPGLGGVTPAALTEPFGLHQLTMRGTSQPRPHCVALIGAVGQAKGCSIYVRRPSPCRDLKAAWEDGSPSPQCDRARQAYGLVPLSRQDWPTLTPTPMPLPA